MRSGKRSSETDISIEECKQFIADKIFVLRPKSYGEKYPLWPGSVGIEIEMLPVLSSIKPKPSLLPLYGKNSISEMIDQLAKKKFWKAIYQDHSQQGPESKKLLKLELELGDLITFEPGGQIEFSTIPYPCLSDAVRRVKHIQMELDIGLKEFGVNLLQLGINPWYSVEDIGLQMTKDRYRAMNQYFSQIGPLGQRMMRQTCTIQPCLDFGLTENDMAKKYLASQLLAPFVTALFAYSPWVENNDSGHLGFRSHIWRGLDPSRTGLTQLKPLVSDLSKESCVNSYLQFALDANVVFVEDFSYEIPHKSLSFSDWMKHGYKGLKPKVKDFANHLSLLFPEVRPRGFLELRSVDGQARPWQFVPAAFYLGLLYDNNKLNQTLDLLIPHIDHIEHYLSLSSCGLEHEEIRTIAKTLMMLAWEGFKGLPPCFRGEGVEHSLKVFGERFTFNGLTPADCLRSEIAASTKSTLTIEDINSLENKWEHWLN